MLACLRRESCATRHGDATDPRARPDGFRPASIALWVFGVEAPETRGGDVVSVRVSHSVSISLALVGVERAFDLSD